MKKIVTVDLLKTFDEMGIRFHEFGTIHEGSKQMFDYYKVDHLSETTKHGLLKKHPTLEFRVSRPMYSREQKVNVICNPKAAKLEASCGKQ